MASIRVRGERDWWDAEKPLPENLTICKTVEELADFRNVLLISDRTDVSDRVAVLEPETLVVYRPRSLVVGVGSRRGVGVGELEGLLRGTFAAVGLAVESIRCIATAELKRDEPAIGLLARWLGAPVRYFGADELNAMPGPSGASESQRLLGIVGVAGACGAAGVGGRDHRAEGAVGGCDAGGGSCPLDWDYNERASWAFSSGDLSADSAVIGTAVLCSSA